jgi:hypothetical protein
VKLRIARVVVAFLSLVVSATPLTSAQTSTQTTSALPRLVRFGGTAKDLNGSPMTGVVGITFALYSEKTGGAALWLETQNATTDSTGHYTVLLGSTKPEGLPAELFTSEQARWVGVQVSGQAEQPRVLLVSAPYALKAGDAETIGGLPPSAFVLAAPVTVVSVPGSSTAATVPPPAATDVTTTGGILNYLPIFSGAATIIDSSVFQTGSGTTGKIGIDTTTPATQLDVNGAGTIRGTLTLPATGLATAAAGGGKNSQGLNLVASSFSSTSSKALNQVFRWQAEPIANDTAVPSGTLNLQYGLGTATPSETGLKISTKGVFTFATGQTFPGVVLADAANTFTGNQTVNGIFAASSSAFGVTGTATTTTGLGIGVAGTAATPNGYGVEGINNATSGGVGVYGSTSAAAGYGVEGINTSGNGTGVYGTAGHFGVQGIATATSGSTVGVYGSGVDGLQGSGTLHGVYAAGTGAASMGVYGTSPGYGLYGVATNTTGTSFGVYGSGGSNGVYGTAKNFGLYGVATATSGNSVGVYGSGVDGLQGSGTIHGVYAAASGTGSFGVYATAPAYGLYGSATGSGSTGVYGTAPQFGVYGVATGSGSTVGVYGNGVDGLQGSGTIHGVYSNGGQYGVLSFTPAGIAGTYGVYQGASATGSAIVGNVPGAAVWADTNFDSSPHDFTIPALLATADDSDAAEFYNNSQFDTLVVSNLGSGGTTNVIRAEGTAGSCTLSGSGDTACTGVLKSVVATTSSAGARRVETYSMQSPENWFEDFGSGALNNGTATITLDPTFTQTVNTGTEYHVFLTPNGDSKGLYVRQKTATSFEVREQGGGASSVAFDYRIVAKRVGYEKIRLTDVTERFSREEARSKNLRRPARSSTGSGSGSQIATPPKSQFRAGVEPMAAQPK